jgi:Flp pilus assembly protein TadG
VIRPIHPAIRRLAAKLRTTGGRLRHDDRASQIAEFALSLPLLVLFVVGIFDFSSAITLKQKLTTAARDAARVAAADPANDLIGGTTPVPASVVDAFYVVDNYLISEKINDCGLKTAEPTQSGSTLTWSSTAQLNGCPIPGIVFTINRGYFFPPTGGSLAPASCVPPVVPTGTQTAIVGTCVTIQYAYKWQFGGVSGLFGGHFIGPSVITTTAVAINEN